MSIPESTTSQSAPFEFGTEDNTLFKDLGSKMLFVGMFFSVIGLLTTVLGVLTVLSKEVTPGIVSLLISGILYVAIGIWTRSAGAEFAAIASTHGADRTHLFGALHNLKKFYTLMYWLAIIATAFFLVTLVYSLFMSGPVQPVA